MQFTFHFCPHVRLLTPRALSDNGGDDGGGDPLLVLRFLGFLRTHRLRSCCVRNRSTGRRRSCQSLRYRPLNVVGRCLSSRLAAK